MSSSFETLLFNAIKNGQIPPKSTYDIWLEAGFTGTPRDFLDSLKGTAAEVVSGVVIKPEDWVSYDGIYKATILNEDITLNDVVNVNFTEISLAAAVNSGVLGYTNTVTGGFELYSNFQPVEDLVINYSIIASTN